MVGGGVLKSGKEFILPFMLIPLVTDLECSFFEWFCFPAPSKVFRKSREFGWETPISLHDFRYSIPKIFCPPTEKKEQKCMRTSNGQKDLKKKQRCINVKWKRNWKCTGNLWWQGVLIGMWSILMCILALCCFNGHGNVIHYFINSSCDAQLLYITIYFSIIVGEIFRPYIWALPNSTYM